MSHELFISDLHLSEQRPDTLRFFLHFLQTQAVQADALYILGDLFDAWIGDDNQHPPVPMILDSLRAVSAQGTRLFMMHGNRDFLLGEAFCDATGATLLADPHVETMSGQTVLLMHGDLLCTDDTAYQAFRQQVRNPAVISEFLSHPIHERLAIAAAYRQKSGEANSIKAADIMDVNAASVEQYITDYSADVLIHGHTHRCATHSLQIGDKSVTRYVLSEWHDNNATILRHDQNGFTMQEISAS